MKREYDTGIRNDVEFFTGIEVEHTPAYAMKTLFVVGIHDIGSIKDHVTASGCDHIYLGANQSFNPGNWHDGTSLESASWDKMINDVLDLGCMVTLDFDVKHVDWVCEGGYSEKTNFIPQISVKIPYIGLLGYNATLKIDDKDFNATNPGVWCHDLHTLQDRKVFTPWRKYSEDTPL
jgi:hypothetical protein